jgi:cobalt-zinc-cadmium efflux system membrane fusion protein
MKRNLLLAAIVAGTLLAWACRPAHDEDEEEHPAAAASELPPGTVKIAAAQQGAMKISVARATLRNLPEVFSVAATIEAPTGKSAEAIAPISGYLETAGSGLPHIGEHLGRGQLLGWFMPAYSAAERVQLESNLTDAEQAERTAAADQQLAREQLERSQRLYHDKVAPLKQVQQDEAALAHADAARASAAALIRQYQSALAARTGAAGGQRSALRAPIAGVIAAVNATPGQFAAAGQSLFTIVNAAVVWVRLAIPENQVGTLADARRGTLAVAAYPGREFELRRVGSSDVVETTTHTLTVVYEAANARGELKPGMSATVQLDSRQLVPQVTVPAAAVVEEAAGPVVFVATGPETFQRRPVTIAFTRDGVTSIGAGLKADEPVVASGASLVESALMRGAIQEED